MGPPLSDGSLHCVATGLQENEFVLRKLVYVFTGFIYSREVSFHNNLTSSMPGVIHQMIWRSVHLIYARCFLTILSPSAK